MVCRDSDCCVVSVLDEKLGVQESTLELIDDYFVNASGSSFSCLKDMVKHYHKWQEDLPLKISKACNRPLI